MLFALLLLYSARSVHIAVDFGSYFTKSSIVKTINAPDMGVDPSGRRLIPTFVAFRYGGDINTTDPSPLSPSDGPSLSVQIGERALSLMSNRPWSGTGYLSAFLDTNATLSQTVTDALIVNLTAARIPKSDIMTFFFRLYLEGIADKHPVTSVTVAVPAAFTIPERRSIEEAVRNAGFKFLKTLDDIDAIAYIYALTRTARYANGSRTVLFVDVGATTVKAYCIRFDLVRSDPKSNPRPSADRLSYAIKNFQGGAFLTSKLADYLKTKHNLAIATDGQRRRLFDAAEKLKIQLTLLREATVTIEEVADTDLSVTVTRDELDAVAADLVSDVIGIAKSASENVTFDDLEIIGGSSRVPIVQSELQSALSVPIGHCLNADEAIALGGGYFAQIHAGPSRFQRVEINNSAVVYGLSAVVGDESIPVCVRNGNCSSSVVIDTKSDTIELEYDRSELKETLISSRFGYRIEGMAENESLTVQLRTSPQDVHSAKLCNGSSICRYAALPPLVPLFAPSPLYYEVLKAEQARKMLGRARNELEQLALRIHDEIQYNDSVKEFTNDAQKFELMSAATEVKSWIEEHADEATAAQNFSEPFKKLSGLIGPVYLRIGENRTLTMAIRLMYRASRLPRRQHSLSGRSTGRI
jgi:molecular chaperone DnaK (HSP70)